MKKFQVAWNIPNKLICNYLLYENDIVFYLNKSESLYIPKIYCAISVVEICLIFLEVYTILKVYFQSEELNWGLNVAQIT